MRTDTVTFRKRVFNDVRALGISSRHSRTLSRRIASGLSYGRYTYGGFVEAPASVESYSLELMISSAQSQRINVHVNGEFEFAVTIDDQILVDVTATPRQLELRDEMYAIVHKIYDLRGGEWETPRLADGTRDFDAKPICIREPLPQEAPEIQALLAHHNVCQAESLAINPHADVTVLDPELADIHYECCKDDGYRPQGYRSLSEIRRYFDRRRSEAANDNSPLNEAV